MVRTTLSVANIFVGLARAGRMPCSPRVANPHHILVGADLSSTIWNVIYAPAKLESSMDLPPTGSTARSMWLCGVGAVVRGWDMFRHVDRDSDETVVVVASVSPTMRVEHRFTGVGPRSEV